MERKRKQGWSSEELRHAWHYRVDRDFSPISNTIKTASDVPTSPFQAPIELISYGSAEVSIPFHDLVLAPYRGVEAAVDPDGRWLAVASGTDIFIYDVQAPLQAPVSLRGHTNNVDNLVFAPGHQCTLVSSADVDFRSNDPEQKPEIIVWNVTEEQTGGEAAFEAGPIAEAAVTTVEERLVAVSAPFTLSADDRNGLLKAVERVVSHCERRHGVAKRNQAAGRLATSFGGEVFSHSGEILVYMPGRRPNSNGDDDWSMKLRWLGDGRELLLKGHRDAIMWTGFSPDDSLLASVAWDGTFRIWRVETGEEVHKWESGKQNWGGCFSPDGMQFLGTDGDGTIRVWNVKSGKEVWRYKAEAEEEFGICWRRHITWSSDGRYIAVGGGVMGLISLFDSQAEVVNGVLRPVQERRLSADGFDFSGLDLHPEDEQLGRSVGGGNFEVCSLRFLQAVGSGGATRGPLWLGSTTYTDGVLELVELYSGQKRRYIPERPTEQQAGGEPREDEYQEDSASDHPPKWVYISGSNQLVIITSKGAFFWSL